ncbi:MAG: carboxypeptidase regulatory-like domain-containing protein [Solirubrobacteraceae bacterium]|nr:carboxypeptidase regulatory-like domain-containing protein [Solirubrobacteraceae bacterium]
MRNRISAIVLTTCAFVGLSASSALAAGFYPAWTITPELTGAQNHDGTLDFDLREFPNATFTSRKSTSDGEPVAIRSSRSWLTAATPFGAVFGPSGPSPVRQFLSTRVDGNEDTVATTTFTFARPTPAGALGIAYGDIDVDALTISATDANGNVVPGSALVGNTFNFCQVPTDVPTECAGEEIRTDIPVWTPTDTGGTFTPNPPPPDDRDTAGASGWLRPATKIKTITAVFRATDDNSGTPSYRTWLAALGFRVTGQVTTTSGREIEDVLISLYSPDGELLDTVRTNSNGDYSFPNFAAGPDYEVRISPPAGYYPASPTEENADLSTRDRVVDFKLTTSAPKPGPGPDPIPGPEPDVDPEPIPGPAGTVTLNYQDVTRDYAYTNVDVPSAGTTKQTVYRKVGRRYVRVCLTSRPSTEAEKDILVYCRLPASARRALRCSDQRFRVQLDFTLATGETTTDRRSYVVAKGKCPRPERKKPAYTG